MKTVFLVIILTLIGFGLAYVKNNPESVNTFFGKAAITPSPEAVQLPATVTPTTMPPTLTPTKLSTPTPLPTEASAKVGTPIIPLQPHSVRVRGGDDEGE